MAKRMEESALAGVGADHPAVEAAKRMEESALAGVGADHPAVEVIPSPPPVLASVRPERRIIYNSDISDLDAVEIAALQEQHAGLGDLE